MLPGLHLFLHPIHPINIHLPGEQANTHELIESLTDGYETLAGDRDPRISGGQRQGVATTRAILILEESTSSLDSESGRLLQEPLDKLQLD